MYGMPYSPSPPKSACSFWLPPRRGDGREVVAGVGGGGQARHVAVPRVVGGNTGQLPSEPFWAQPPPAGGRVVVVVDAWSWCAWSSSGRGRLGGARGRGHRGGPRRGGRGWRWGWRCGRQARGEHERAPGDGHEEEQTAAHGVLSASGGEILERGGEGGVKAVWSGEAAARWVAPTMIGRCLRSPARPGLDPQPVEREPRRPSTCTASSSPSGCWSAVYVAEQRWRRRGYPRDGIYDIAFWVVIGGVIGARLYHVVTDYQLFEDDRCARFADLAGRAHRSGAR